VATWRVAPADSMFIADPSGFDYQGQEALAYPKSLKTIEDIAGPALDLARQNCSHGGLQGDELEWCAYDVAATGDDGFALAEPISSQRSIVVAHPERIEVQPPSAPGTSAGPSISAQPTAQQPTVLHALAEQLVPPNSTEFSRHESEITLELVYTSTNLPTTLLDFYQQRLASLGIEPSISGDLVLFTAPNGVSGGILVRANDTGSSVNVSLKRQ
jgi:hypothetical protein